MDFRGEHFDYDPITGIQETYEEHGDGTVSIHQYQDIQPYLDFNAELRNAGHPDDAWRKSGATLYAAIPPVVQAQLFKRGINIMDPNDLKKLIDTINTDYPYLKTTYKHHAIR